MEADGAGVASSGQKFRKVGLSSKWLTPQAIPCMKSSTWCSLPISDSALLSSLGKVDLSAGC